MKYRPKLDEWTGLTFNALRHLEKLVGVYLEPRVLNERGKPFNTEHQRFDVYDEDGIHAGAIGSSATCFDLHELRAKIFELFNEIDPNIVHTDAVESPPLKYVRMTNAKEPSHDNAQEEQADANHCREHCREHNYEEREERRKQDERGEREKQRERRET